MLETSMDTSFYPDDLYSNPSLKMRHMKRMMTLELDGPSSVAKRGKFTSLLSSPDLNMLKLGSPELESLLIQQHGHVTTTPTPGQYTFPKTVTEEQELYAKGFVEALAELHQYGQDSYSTSVSSPSTSNSTTDADVLAQWNQQTANVVCQQLTPATYATTNSYSDFGGMPVTIKEEPQTVPSCSRDSPPLSPIDMMAQERIKLERKRQRNRLAASKCRRRKLERIARLEDKVNGLKDENTILSTTVVKLKDSICRLKEQLMEHVNSGCQVMSPHSDYIS